MQIENLIVVAVAYVVVRRRPKNHFEETEFSPESLRFSFPKNELCTPKRKKNRKKKNSRKNVAAIVQKFKTYWPKIAIYLFQIDTDQICIQRVRLTNNSKNVKEIFFLLFYRYSKKYCLFYWNLSDLLSVAEHEQN